MLSLILFSSQFLCWFWYVKCFYRSNRIRFNIAHGRRITLVIEMRIVIVFQMFFLLSNNKKKSLQISNIECVYWFCHHYVASFTTSFTLCWRQRATLQWNPQSLPFDTWKMNSIYFETTCRSKYAPQNDSFSIFIISVEQYWLEKLLLLFEIFVFSLCRRFFLLSLFFSPVLTCLPPRINNIDNLNEFGVKQLNKCEVI